MADRPRGMGRGLAAILTPTMPPDGTETDGRAARVPVDLIAPNPRQPRQQLRRGVAARALRVGA